MFTGIICGIGRVANVIVLPGLTKLAVGVTPSLLVGLQKGASVAIDGICLTVVDFDDSKIWFDVIAETLQQTTLKSVEVGAHVNIERAARFGDEIGGHMLSGHISGTTPIISILRTENNCILTFQGSPQLTKYLFPKGYIALNGASLTLVDVNNSSGAFTVHLIPETLERSTFGTKKVGDVVNVEYDSQTQAIVDTIERYYACKSTN
ncbi:MAG: riboflavin synthase subunit alpha [Parachlamydiaceae bacterium]